MSRELNRMAGLFRAYDQRHFGLPAAVLAARSVYSRLVSAESPCEPVDLGRVDMALVEGLLDQAGKDEPSWPTPVDVMAARAASEASEAWSAARSAALEQAEEGLSRP